MELNEKLRECHFEDMEKMEDVTSTLNHSTKWLEYYKSCTEWLDPTFIVTRKLCHVIKNFNIPIKVFAQSFCK